MCMFNGQKSTGKSIKKFFDEIAAVDFHEFSPETHSVGLKKVLGNEIVCFSEN